MINMHDFGQTRRVVPSGEGGSALIFTLLILMVLSLMATVAIRSTNTGVRAAGAYKNYQENLYIADGAADYGFAIIERTVGNSMEVDPLIDAANVTSSPNLVLEINASSVNNLDSADPDSPNYAPNASITIAGETVDIDIDFERSDIAAGSSTEFAARYDGSSTTGGSLLLIYQVEANYKKDVKNESTIRINFQCVEGGGRCL